MGIESRRASYYVEIPNLTARKKNDKIGQYVSEFANGNFGNKQCFVSNYARLAISIGSKFKTKEFSPEDAVSEAFLAVCLVPQEIFDGKYNPLIPIDNYVKSRIKSRCLNQARRNWLLRVPWHEAQKGTKINRRNIIYPGEVVGDYKPEVKPIEVIKTLAMVDSDPLEEPIKCEQGVAFTIGERQIIDLLKEGYTVAQIARKLDVAHNTVKYRIKKIGSKLCVSENTFLHLR